MSKPAANKKDKKKKKKGAADEDEMYNFADPSDDVGDLKEAAVSEGNFFASHFIYSSRFHIRYS